MSDQENLDALDVEENDEELYEGDDEKKELEEYVPDTSKLDELRAMLSKLTTEEINDDVTFNVSQMSEICIEVNWEPIDEGKEVVLEAECFALNDKGYMLGHAYNEEKEVMGDALMQKTSIALNDEGEEVEGLDNQLWVDVSKLPLDCRAVFFLASAYRGPDLDEVQSLVTTVRDTRRKANVQVYSQKFEVADATSVILCSLIRSNTNPLQWTLSSMNRAMLEASFEENYPTLKKIVKELPVRTVVNATTIRRTTPNLNISALGRCLNTVEKSAVSGAMIKLQLSHNVTAPLFWGKIFGQQADYIIMCETAIDSKISKRFWYSVNGGFDFSPVPTVDSFIRQKSLQHMGMFKGKPSLIYKDIPPYVEKKDDDEESDMEEEDEEEVDTPLKPRLLREEERLAYAINCIDTQTCIVPKGLYMLTSDGQIVQDSKFQGLGPTEAQLFSNYLLLKNPELEKTVVNIGRRSPENRYDFLDTIEGDGRLVGLWSLQDDSGTRTKFSLRSLLCPGFQYHLTTDSIENGAFAGAYFGNGVLNHSVLHMIN